MFPLFDQRASQCKWSRRGTSRYRLWRVDYWGNSHGDWSHRRSFVEGNTNNRPAIHAMYKPADADGERCPLDLVFAIAAIFTSGQWRVLASGSNRFSGPANRIQIMGCPGASYSGCGHPLIAGVRDWSLLSQQNPIQIDTSRSTDKNYRNSQPRSSATHCDSSIGCLL
jgi:hypothetical protein